MDSQQDSQPSTILEDLLYAVSSHRWLILIVFVSVVIGAYLALQLATDVYEVEGQLLVKLGRENAEVPVTVEKGGVISSGVRKEEIESEIRLLLSRPLIEAALDELGMDAFEVTEPLPKTLLERIKHRLKAMAKSLKQSLRDLFEKLNLTHPMSKREKLIHGLSNGLKAERERDSDVIGVTLRTALPEAGLRYLDTLLRLYLDHHVEVRREVDVRDLFEERLDFYRQRMDQLADERKRLRADLGLTAIDEERKLLLRRVDAIGRELDRIARERAMFPQRRRLKRLARDGFSMPELESVKARLAQLRIEREQLLQGYDPASEKVRMLDTQMRKLEALAVAGLDTQEGKLKAQAQRLRERLQVLNDAENRLDRIRLEYKVASRQYNDMARRLEEARIDQGLDLRRVSNVAILSPPELPLTPVAPRKTLVMALSIPLGLLLGIGFALLVDYMGDRIRGYRDIERIAGLTSLGRFKPDRDGFARHASG